MNDHVDMAAFVEAKSDQLNADDLIGAPRTIRVRKVTGNDGDQPVSIFYEGDDNKPFRPCKTMRRVLLAIWGRYTKDYIGRSMTLYRDDGVTFGGLQVGGIRISHMSHMEKETLVVVLKSKGKKAGIKVMPLVMDRQQSPDFSGQLAELRALAKPGNMDALGAAWKKIGADARKALAAELPALKAACERPTDGQGSFSDEREDVPFDGAAEDEQPPQVNDSLADQIGLDEHPGKAVADAIIAEINAPECNAVMDVARVLDRHANDIQALSDEDAVRVEVAADKRRAAIRAEQGVEAAK